MDAPEMETVIVEKEYEHGPMGAKGVRELPMDGGAPAIANAIARGISQGTISAKKGGSIRSIKLPSHITDRLKNKVRH